MTGVKGVWRFLIVSLAVSSACLSIVVVGCAGSILHTYQSQRDSNPYWLPLWPQHFDDRALKALIGGGSGVVVSNVIFVTLLYTALKWQYAPILISLLGGTISWMCALGIPAQLNKQTPFRETMQTWTCAWGSDANAVSAGAPRDFASICSKNKLAFYTMAPIAMLQIVITGITLLLLTRHWREERAAREKRAHQLPCYGAASDPGEHGKNEAQVRMETL